MSQDKTPTPPASNSGTTPASCTTQPCPLKKKKLLKVEWSPVEAMCGDPVALTASAENMDANTAATAQATVTQTSKLVATLQANGQDSFVFPWEVKEVVFPATSPPDKYEVKGKVSAAGESAETVVPLAVKRIPDKDPEAVSLSIVSTAVPAPGTGNYAWEMKFRVGFKQGEVTTEITMQFKKAWKGYWVSFDPAAAPAGDGKSGWAFVKKEGAQWKYWNEAATPAAWADLPRAVGSYTLNGMFFVFDGTHYMQRGGSAQWPEAFPDSPDFASRKTHWLGKIHETWDGRFQLHRKLCPSTDHKCCTWPIKIRGEWAEDAGDKLVYGIWTQAYQNERSNASDWYLGDQRDGLGPHEFGHLLGAYDEYTGGALDPTGGTGGTPGPIEPNCIMGQNLPLTAKERHLNNWRDEVKKKINAWTSHTWDFEVKPR